jgi:hypothetical protein
MEFETPDSCESIRMSEVEVESSPWEIAADFRSLTPFIAVSFLKSSLHSQLGIDKLGLESV